MHTRNAITPDILRQLLRYEPETGALFWRRRELKWFACYTDWYTFNFLWAGKPAFTSMDRDGYFVGAVFHHNFKAHRVCWMIATGECPDQIDHINGVRNDNRLANLRSVDFRGNATNTARAKNNTSGTTGVHWDKGAGAWVARISMRGERHLLGAFDKIEDAIRARKEAETRFGYHPNHGRG
jgi:hypothetical protein